MNRTIFILGSGIMGCDLALLFARHGWQVVVWHRTDAGVAQQRWESRVDGYTKRGILSPGEQQELRQSTSFTSSFQQASSSDWILETIAEADSLKRDLLVALDSYRRADSILASNTSSIDLESLAACLKGTESFLGVHFFNPVLRMPLVEVAPVRNTALPCLQKVDHWLTSMGMEPIRVQARAGLVVNRLMAGLIVQAFRLWDEGVAAPADIDRLGAGVLGHPLGPFALADFIGLDVVEAILTNLSASLPDTALTPPDSLKDLVRQNWLGRKTGRGVFEYPPHPSD